MRNGPTNKIQKIKTTQALLIDQTQINTITYQKSIIYQKHKNTYYSKTQNLPISQAQKITRTIWAWPIS